MFPNKKDSSTLMLGSVRFHLDSNVFLPQKNPPMVSRLLHTPKDHPQLNTKNYRLLILHTPDPLMFIVYHSFYARCIASLIPDMNNSF